MFVNNLPQQNMKTAGGWTIVTVVFALILLSILSRFVLVDWPNFKQIGAVAIFLGYWLRRVDVAALVVVLVMLASDWVIGFYDYRLMLSVYGAMVLACGIGYLLKGQICSGKSVVNELTSTTAAALVASILFFVITNSAVWMFGGFYSPNVEGWLTALAAGLPFFKFTCWGNLLFTPLLFACLKLVESSAILTNNSQRIAQPSH